jgi:hypothetical protein
MHLTRSRLLGGAAAGALVAVGGYELVDRLAGAPERTPVTTFPPEQHLLDGVAVVVDNDVEVLVPPLHHQVVTARLAVDESPRTLRRARDELERVLRSLEDRYPPSPAGLGITVAWALPYFERYVPGQARAHIPVDRRATAARGREIRVLVDAERFPSDPAETVLESNDVAVLLRSDSVDAIAEGAAEIFGEQTGIFRVTSVRKGFAGGGFDGSTSLPKQMAMAAAVPGADLIPETSELFLGFTSTQKHGLGPARIANLETLGYVDLSRSDYFAQGTHMHLSHIHEDLETWYLNMDHRERVDTTFRPGLDVAPETLTVPQPPEDAATTEQVATDYDTHRRIGHSAAIQVTSRLSADVTGPDGTVYPVGTAIPQRADFNTLDNPFFWSVDPERDGMGEGAAAGVHFVVFNPTGDDFRRNRLAMDGVLPDGTELPFEPGSRGQGINAVLKTTHRQNFLVPPRRHRAFPLVELRS